MVSIQQKNEYNVLKYDYIDIHLCLDTVGYFSSLTTSVPADEDANSTCRGDNPQGCTRFWTSARDESITSFHSSIHYSQQTSGKGLLYYYLLLCVNYQSLTIIYGLRGLRIYFHFHFLLNCFNLGRAAHDIKQARWAVY